MVRKRFGSGGDAGLGKGRPLCKRCNTNGRRIGWYDVGQSIDGPEHRPRESAFTLALPSTLAC